MLKFIIIYVLLMFTIWLTALIYMGVVDAAAELGCMTDTECGCVEDCLDSAPAWRKL